MANSWRWFNRSIVQGRKTEDRSRRSNRFIAPLGFNRSKTGTFTHFRIPETSKCLSITAAAKKSPDLVMVAEERNEKFGASVLKDKSQTVVTTAFEEFAS